MPIVTISRQYGSGGSEVAERVANALGWQLYDNAVVDEVASRLGMTSAAVSAREERIPTLGERLASAISLSAPEAMAMIGDDALPPSEERILEVTRRVMEEAVQSGPAVIVGRGAPALLEKRSDALHVFCCAPLDALVAYAVTNLGVAAGEARRNVIEANARRGEYVRRHWQREWLDMSNYHVCVNTGLIGVDGAADLVIRMAEGRFG